jgi:hypothetical protein
MTFGMNGLPVFELTAGLPPAIPLPMQNPVQNPEPTKTIRYGSEQVEVLERDWQTGERLPYRKTYALRPGQSWFDADVTPGQWEHYVLRKDGVQVPVGAVIAAELKEE